MDELESKDSSQKDLEKINNDIHTVAEIINNFNYTISQIYGFGIYIRGEISSLARNGKWYYTYFDLIDVDKDASGQSEKKIIRGARSSSKKKDLIKCIIREEKEEAVVENKLPRKNENNNGAQSINHTNLLNNLEANTGKTTLSSGMIGIFLCKPVFYGGNGSLSFKVINYTLQSVTGEFLDNLQKRYKVLEEKGYFLKEKKTIVQYPKSIAIICGNQSMVYYDIIKNLYRKWPIVDIHVEKCYVQGGEALNTLLRGIKNIEKINEEKEFDFLIIARGGGSLIDILPFFEEKLIEKVFNLDIPVVSAIGHETDKPYLDYVADRRLSTPSMIVSLVPDIDDEINYIKSLGEYLIFKSIECIDLEFYKLDSISVRNELDKQISLKFQKDEYELGELEEQFLLLVSDVFNNHIEKIDQIVKSLYYFLENSFLNEIQKIRTYKQIIIAAVASVEKYIYKYSIYSKNKEDKKKALSIDSLKTDNEYYFFGKDHTLKVKILEINK